MKKISFCLTLLMAILLSSCAGKYSYRTVANDPMQTRIYTLDNGLTVYMAVNKEQPRLQANIAVRVGGKNDPAETTGLAHYFEHLMFKGTHQFGTQNYEAEKPMLDQIEQLFELYRQTTDPDQRAAIYHQIDSVSYQASTLAIPNEYDKLMSAIGANGTNAYTGYDQTVYVEDIPSNQIENWAKIQADRFENATIRGFHTELETVYEEKNMSLTSDGRKVVDAMLSGLFKHHPYGTQTILGTQEHLKNPSITNIKNYFNTWYVPNNMAICLSGDFDPDKMIAIIDKYFGSMQPNDNLPTLACQAEDPITEPVVREVLGVEAENVAIGWRACGAADKDADLLNIISGILYNGTAGLIDLDINQQQKALQVYGFGETLADYGLLMISGRPKAGQSLEEVRDLILAEVAKVAAGEFSNDMLEAIINNYKLNQMQYMDDNEGRADLLVGSFINRIDWKDEVAQLDRMSKITKEDVMAYARQNFTDKNYVAVYKRQGKDPNENKISKPTITPIATNRDAQSQFLTDIQQAEVKPIEPVFVDYAKDLNFTTAKSNIPLIYKKNPTTDLFMLSYIFEEGVNNDPSLMIVNDYFDYLGTSTMTAEQIKQALYQIACSTSVRFEPKRTYITISGLSENMERAMELIEVLIADAQPNEEALANLKSDNIKSRADRKLNQRSNFNALTSYGLYGEVNPFNHVLTNEQLEALTSKELIDKMQHLFTLEHRISYYGPASQKEVIKAIDRCHNVPEQLTAAPEPVKILPQPTPVSKVYMAQYDAKQIYFQQISNRGEKFDVNNDADVALFNEYFGGGMNAIVFQEMREARGLAYSASGRISQPSDLDIPYTFYAFIATQNDKMVDAIKAFEDIINQTPLSEKAFNLAKEGLLARLRTERTTKYDVISSYLKAQDLGVTTDRNQAIFEKVQSMTLDDISAIQQKWIKDRTYNYCILGDIKDLDLDYLNSLGEITILSQPQIFGY